MHSLATVSMLWIALLVHGGFASDPQDEIPPIFSSAGFDTAVEQNKTSGKVLVVKATATWCLPCKQMDRTTWREGKVLEWFASNGVAIQFDVDKEPALSKKLGIQAMPTMIAFRKGEEFDRIVGYKDATDLLAWVDGVQNGKKSIEAVRTRVDRAEKGSDAEIQARSELASELVRTGKLDEATEEFVWLWTHTRGTSFTGVRVSFMASEMEELAARHPLARTRFVGLRDELTPRLGGEKVDHDDVGDWIVLHRIVGESEKVLAWFDLVKTDPRWLLLFRHSFELEDMLEAKGRWADLALLHPEPAKELLRNHEMHALASAHMERSESKDGPDYKAIERQLFQRDAGKLYAAMLAADRTEDAQAVVKLALELDDSSAMRLALVRRALTAEEPRAEHAALLDAVEKKGDAKGVSALRKRLDKALGAGEKR